MTVWETEIMGRGRGGRGMSAETRASVGSRLARGRRLRHEAPHRSDTRTTHPRARAQALAHDEEAKRLLDKRAPSHAPASMRTDSLTHFGTQWRSRSLGFVLCGSASLRLYGAAVVDPILEPAFLNHPRIHTTMSDFPVPLF